MRIESNGQESHRRGFTLVELLCVIVILAIAAVFVIPQLSSRGDIKTAAAARTLMADIMYAQNRAIAKQTPQYVVFDLTAHTYALKEGSSLTTLTHPVQLKPYLQTFGSSGLEDVTLTSATFDSKTTIAFDEIGAPYSYDSIAGLVALSVGQIKLTSEGYTLTLNVQPYTGEIALQTP
ncbi:N/A [soil metagenome]